jgi:uncharacterized protein YukE
MAATMTCTEVCGAMKAMMEQRKSFWNRSTDSQYQAWQL